MMIPFDFTEPKIVPYCTEYLKAVASDHPYFTPFVTQCLPLECIICATKPRFVVSDKYHTICCEFTKKALFSFKRSFFNYKLYTLKGKYAVIRGYFPYCTIKKSSVADLYLIVTSFELIRGSNIAYAPAPNVPSVMEAPELTTMMDIVQSRCFRKAMELRTAAPQMMETMLTDPEKAEFRPLILTGVDDASKLIQEVVEEGLQEMLESGDKILNYEYIDVEERMAEGEVRKVRYRRFNSEDEEIKEEEHEEEMGKQFVKEDVDPDLEQAIAKELEGGLLTKEEKNEFNAGHITNEVAKLLEASPYEKYVTDSLCKVAEVSVPVNLYGVRKQKTRDFAMKLKDIKKFSEWKAVQEDQTMKDISNVLDAPKPETFPFVFDVSKKDSDFPESLERVSKKKKIES